MPHSHPNFNHRVPGCAACDTSVLSAAPEFLRSRPADYSRPNGVDESGSDGHGHPASHLWADRARSAVNDAAVNDALINAVRALRDNDRAAFLAAEHKLISVAHRWGIEPRTILVAALSARGGSGRAALYRDN